VPFLLATYLLENYPGDPKVRRAVDQSEIWIVPLVNPTAWSIRYIITATGERTGGSTPTGASGWTSTGTTATPGVRRLRLEPGAVLGYLSGSAPFSESETRAVRDLFEQRHFRALISYHSFSQVILYAWGYINIPTDQDARDMSIASAMSTLMEAVNGRFYKFGPSSSSLYLTNGDTTDWAFGVAGIPAYTIELPPIDELGGGFFNAETDIQPIFEENLPAALYLIDWAISDFGASARRRPASE